MAKRARTFASSGAIKRHKKLLRRSRAVRPRNPRRLLTKVQTGLGFPRQVVKTLRYAELISITSTTGILQTYRFIANGLYDPNITGTGHQPLYFDQVMSLYNQYTVIGSKIECRFVPSSTNTSPVAVILMLDDDTTLTPTDITGVQEQSQANRLRIVHVNESNPIYLSKKFSAKKTFGGSLLSNNNLTGSSVSNPIEGTYFDICAQTIGGTTASVSVEVLITYIAVFNELKDVAQS